MNLNSAWDIFESSCWRELEIDPGDAEKEDGEGLSCDTPFSWGFYEKRDIAFGKCVGYRHRDNSGGGVCSCVRHTVWQGDNGCHHSDDPGDVDIDDSGILRCHIHLPADEHCMGDK